MEKINVLIIDDHPLFRQGICWSLSVEKDIEVVGQAENGTQAIKLTETLSPHVVLLDINLPGLNGLEVARVLKRRAPHMGIIVLTIHDDDEQLFNAIKAGAAAYASKDVDPQELIKMIREVAKGRYLINDNVFSKPHVASRVLNQFRDLSSTTVTNEDTVNVFAPLTSREIEILDCVARGLSNKEIAGQLSISGQTVKNHITSILSKLQVNDRTMAVIHAIQQGWIKLGYDDVRERLNE